MTPDIWPRVSRALKSSGTNSISATRAAHRRNPVYEFARELAPPPPDSFDAVLCAIILHAMAEAREIRLQGPADKRDASEFEWFQLAWSRWLPTVYRPVEIEVDSVISQDSCADTAVDGGILRRCRFIIYAASQQCTIRKALV